MGRHVQGCQGRDKEKPRTPKGPPEERLGGGDSVLTFSFLWLLVFLREKSQLLRDFLHFRVEPLEA